MLLDNIDAGSVALGMMISLIGWGIFIFIIFYPAIKKSGTKLKQDIKKDMPEMMKEAVPILKEEFKKELPAIKKDFMDELPALADDIKKKLNIPDFDEIEKKLKASIPDIPTVDDLILQLTAKLMDEEDEDTQNLMSIASLRIVKAIKYHLSSDPEIKEYISTVLKAEIGDFKKEVQTLIKEVATKYGFGGEGGEGVPDNVKKFVEIGQFLATGKKLLAEGLPTI